MADPLLSSLCTICHINAPKYTCPRCTVQTCSLPCVKRHKIWSSCSGLRDPTIYKPRSELMTAAGVDHDYNFLHSIEHKIERAEKELLIDQGIITKEDLGTARIPHHGHSHSKLARPKQPAPGEECIEAMLRMMGTKIHRAPKGMKRSSENGTSWSRGNRQINWQIEWMRDAGTTRQLGKMLGDKSVGYHYDAFFEEDRRLRMTAEEKRKEKKRKADIIKQRTAKRTKLDSTIDTISRPLMQNWLTGAWNITAQSLLDIPNSRSNLTQAFSPDSYEKVNDHQLYLLRPLTSSKYPKVLVPINMDEPLMEVLRNREIVEFPTIYVFENRIEQLPEGFILEQQYLKESGQSSDTNMDSSGSSSEDDNETSDSSSSRDEEMEDGEIDE